MGSNRNDVFWVVLVFSSLFVFVAGRPSISSANFLRQQEENYILQQQPRRSLLDEEPEEAQEESMSFSYQDMSYSFSYSMSMSMIFDEPFKPTDPPVIIPTVITIPPEIIGIIWEIGQTDFSIIIDAEVNDLLIFEFNTEHDVYLMSQSEYDTCTFNGVKIIGDTAPVFYTIPSEASSSTLYFGCSVATHCSEFGMKIQVNVA